MVGKSDDTSSVTWGSLNKRQQDYLAAIYQADQEVEVREHSRWNRGSKPRPAEQWRWMPYATSFPSGLPMEVKQRLKWTEQVNEGTGSTLEALEKRGLILIEHLSVRELQRRGIISPWHWTIESDPIPTIQITPAGRKMVRSAFDIPPKKMVVGSLQAWHWKALAKAYVAGGQGVPEDGVGYGGIGWNTWLRLRDYKIRGEMYPLVKEVGGITISAWGIAYYERSFARYSTLYPDVVALAPSTPHDPHEPYVEMLQGSRHCPACTGQYLVSITRTYQQDHKAIWSVSQHEQRIPGMVTKKYGFGDVEQCGCEEGEIEEMNAPFLTILGHLTDQGWTISFPYHHWISYLDYLVGGINAERKQRWHTPTLVREKVQPLENDEEFTYTQNIMRGDVRYYWNPCRGKGKVYVWMPDGTMNISPVAITKKGE